MSASTTAQTTNRIDCLCGCGQETSAKANYRPGHDAAHVSILLAELYNSLQDGRSISDDMIKSQAKSLPSQALQIKFTNAANKLADKAATKKAKAELELHAMEGHLYQIGRWTYAVAEGFKGGKFVGYFREDKKSGDFIPAEGGKVIDA